MEWAGRAAPEAARTVEGDAPSSVPTVELLS